MIHASKNYWVISDRHHQHKNILTFKDDDGNLIRPGFSSIEEMDEKLIENWNKEVTNPNDTVYDLGDVTFGNYEKYCIDIAPRLMGKKELILGNHDRIKGTRLMDFFERVHAVWHYNEEFGIVMTHLPIEQHLFRRNCTHNVHGHIHAKSLQCPLHANVCVERTGYKPINLEEISKFFGN